MKKIKSQLPLLSALITLVIEVFLPDSSLHKVTGHAYLVWFIAILVLLYEIFIIVGTRGLKDRLLYKAAFYAVFFQVLNIFNILTAKYAVLPVLYFPSPDRILEVLVTDWMFLGQCLLYTLRIQLSGWLVGVLSGVLSAIVDTFTIAITDISLFPLYEQNDAYWKVIAFSTAVGGCLLSVGSVSGLALMKMEHMKLGWYLRNLTLKVALGFMLGLLVLYLETIIF